MGSSNQFTTFATALDNLFDQMFTPLISVAIALTAIMGVMLGFKFWKAQGDETKLKEAKHSVWYFVIGIVVVFVVVVGAPMLFGALSDWMNASAA
jgi:uncharacterized membrane protein YidH (DUF202 family)